MFGLTLKVVMAPVKMKLNQIVISVEIAAHYLDSVLGRFVVSRHNNTVSVVRHVPFVHAIVVLEYNRLEVLVVFDVRFDNVNRRLSEAFAFGECVGPRVRTFVLVVPIVYLFARSAQTYLKSFFFILKVKRKIGLEDPSVCSY